MPKARPRGLSPRGLAVFPGLLKSARLSLVAFPKRSIALVPPGAYNEGLFAVDGEQAAIRLKNILFAMKSGTA
jgi:hypothetical protein